MRQSKIAASLRFLADASCCCLQTIACSADTLGCAEIEVCQGDFHGVGLNLSLCRSHGLVHAPINRALARISGTQVECRLAYALPGVPGTIGRGEIQPRQR